MKKVFATASVLVFLFIATLLFLPQNGPSPCQKFAAENSQNYIQFYCADSVHAIYKKSFGKDTDSTYGFDPYFLYFGTIDSSHIRVDSLLGIPCDAGISSYHQGGPYSRMMRFRHPDSLLNGTTLHNHVNSFDSAEFWTKGRRKYFPGYREFYMEIKGIDSAAFEAKLAKDDSIRAFFATTLGNLSACNLFVKTQNSFLTLWRYDQRLSLFEVSRDSAREIFNLNLPLAPKQAEERHPIHHRYISWEIHSNDYFLSEYQAQPTDSAFRFQSQKNGDVIIYDFLRDTVAITLGPEKTLPRSILFNRKDGTRLVYETAEMAEFEKQRRKQIEMDYKS